MSKSHAVAPNEWYDEMRRLFGAGRYEEAGSLYDRAIAHGDQPSVEAQLLRGRVILKRDQNAAVAFLIDHEPNSVQASWNGRWSMYLGAGYARMFAFDNADRHFANAENLLVSAPDRSALAYHRGRRMLLECRLDDARLCADGMSCDSSLLTKIDQELLRSFISTHEENYLEAAHRLLATVRLIGDRRNEYPEQWFHSVENLAALARELTLDEARAVARREVDRNIEWPQDFALQHFQALKAVGWCCALKGDALGCLRYLRMAEAVAPSSALKTILLLDRARFAAVVGERNWAQNEVDMAEAVADRLDWNSLAGDERIGLLLLAESFAKVSEEKARFYLARYAALEKIRSPLHLYAFDDRLEAIAAFVVGIVDAASGDPAAEASLRKAWVIFDRIGYDWRAGRTAIALYKLTGKRRWLLLAADKLEPYSDSWLGEEFRFAESGRAYIVELPPMQAKVFEMLCRKKSTAEIATELSLSQHTVRNHLKSVFKAYGVNNRSALMAEAARRGAIALPQETARSVPEKSRSTRLI
jgi:DNA-binding CsgD family transcriptional regulator